MKKAQNIVNIADHVSNPTNWFQTKGSDKIIPSAAEKLIKAALSKMPHEFHTEISFKGLRYKSGHYARFDFWLPDIGTIIEYDGEDYHSSNEAIQRDELKNQFCKKQGIELIRLDKKHYYKLESEISKILSVSVISDKLYEKIAPLKVKQTVKSIKKRQEVYKKKVEDAFRATPKNPKLSKKELELRRKVKKMKSKDKDLGIVIPKGMTMEEYQIKQLLLKQMREKDRNHESQEKGK